MKTLVWLTSIFALSAFLFSATVHAANNLVDNLSLDKPQNTIQEFTKK